MELATDSHAISAITRTVNLGTLLNLSERCITLPWNGARVSRRNDYFSEQERFMCLGPSKRVLALACSHGIWPVDERCCLPYWTGVGVFHDTPEKYTCHKTVLWNIKKLKKTKQVEWFAYKQYLKSSVKVQSKGNCISTLRGFLKTKFEDQGFKEHSDWLFTSIPLCFWYFCEHVLTSNCGWECRKDAVCALVWALNLAQRASEALPRWNK